MYTACVIETFLAIGLIFVILPVFAGLIGFIHLLVAGGAVWKVTKGKWLWNIGGYEYCLFGADCCLVVAMHYSKVGQGALADAARRAFAEAQCTDCRSRIVW